MFLNGVFVPGKPFQHTLMFASKAGGYSSGAPFKDSTIRVFCKTCPQTLDKAGKACEGQTL